MPRINVARTAFAALVVAALFVARTGKAGGEDDATAAKVKTSKHTLLEGVQSAQKGNGAAISAKIEFEDGKLQLSVYTAKAGLEKDAEHNVLIELQGETTSAKWDPKTEVFEDREHLGRASAQLTALQTASISLEDAIKKASALKKGSVFSAIPSVKDGKSVVVVLIATPAGKSLHVVIDETTK
ncbi:MAG TPA: hypothetical protein VNO21_13670 [Polyangiaceae bacterium]|nr:hypothetical protein [Polyangiaceae bacterium]